MDGHFFDSAFHFRFCICSYGTSGSALNVLCLICDFASVHSDVVTQFQPVLPISTQKLFLRGI